MTGNQGPSFSLTSGLLMAALAILWGGSFFFAEVALTQVSPLTIVMYRVVCASAVLFAVVCYQKLMLPRSIGVWGCYLVMGLLNNAIPFSLIFWAQVSLESGLASILNSTTAFFGVIVAGVLLADERLTVRKIIGTVFGVFGVAAIIGLDAVSNFDIRNLAQLAILAAALSYALASVWAKKMLADQVPVMNAFGMLTCSCLFMIPIAFLYEGVPDITLSVDVWAAILSLAVLSTALAYLLYFSLLKRVGSANLMLVTLLIPPVTVVLGVTILGEVLTSETLFGFALIAIGLLIIDGRLFNLLQRRFVK